MADETPFAGVWRPSKNSDRMAFFTCELNALVGAVHPEAMPVMLEANDQESWLSGSYEEETALARPPSDDRVRALVDERTETLL